MTIGLWYELEERICRYLDESPEGPVQRQKVETVLEQGARQLELLAKEFPNRDTAISALHAGAARLREAKASLTPPQLHKQNRELLLKALNLLDAAWNGKRAKR